MKIPKYVKSQNYWFRGCILTLHSHPLTQNQVFWQLIPFLIIESHILSKISGLDRPTYNVFSMHCPIKTKQNKTKTVNFVQKFTVFFLRFCLCFVFVHGTHYFVEISNFFVLNISVIKMKHNLGLNFHYSRPIGKIVFFFVNTKTSSLY